ncbi:MAG: dihydropteroate synthase [Pigmentiphaga sp.]|uniref:dihydropteroate synthase n=1 Tax=Pigmentiphaga sp. TaxID=1977564 RepID=UPI0029B5AE12|nr:dihydropteroate synthase [Pigmentiphaga sp.]MDX3904315.1 dihydropteroate synthase [Pigmentiphaga sp.]
MGIINVTPDSFSDGGKNLALDAAIAHAHALIAEGADILDLGGESTRPGAQPVSQEDELARLLPLIEALRATGVPLSVDTFKPGVMHAVLDAGADMINDIYGFRQPGAIEAVARGTSGLCVMHMQGEPRTMQQAPVYADVVGEVSAFLAGRAERLSAAGVRRERICLDPGFGFGKTTGHNYQLMRSLPAMGALGYPLLIGVSRKTMIGAVTGKPVGERLAGSVAAALAAVDRGAAIVRVHDVAATVDALKVWRAVQAWDD